MHNPDECPLRRWDRPDCPCILKMVEEGLAQAARGELVEHNLKN